MNEQYTYYNGYDTQDGDRLIFPIISSGFFQDLFRTTLHIITHIFHAIHFTQDSVGFLDFLEDVSLDTN